MCLISDEIELKREVENAGTTGSDSTQTVDNERDISVEMSKVVHTAGDDYTQQEGEEDIQTTSSVETLAATAGITGKSEKSVPASETIQTESRDPKERALTHAAEPLKGTLTGMLRSFPLFLIK